MSKIVREAGEDALQEKLDRLNKKIKYYKRYFYEDLKEARKYWDEHNLGDVNEQIDIMLGKQEGK